MKRTTLLGLLLGSLAAAPLFAWNPQPDPPGYGMIGIVPGETLRLNVSNVPLASPGVPPDPCRVELTFVDDAGTPLLPAVQRTLAPGESAHLDLNGDDLFPPSNVEILRRAEVRPVIRILLNSTGIAAIPPGPCVSTIEILDNATGRTLLSSGPQHPGEIYEWNPQPDPPKTFGIVGIAAGQTARLTASNTASPGELAPPCRVAMALLDADGNVVAQKSETLEAGQSTLLDVSSNTLPPPADVAPGPAQLRGVVVVESAKPGEIPPPCRASLEVFDEVTGATTALLSPQRVPATNLSAGR